MSTYAVKRKFKTGRVAKTPVVYIKAANENDAWDVFCKSEIWATYDQYTPFFLEETDSTISRKWIISDDDVMDRY